VTPMDTVTEGYAQWCPSMDGPGNEANACVEAPVSLCKLVLKWLHVKYSLNIFTAVAHVIVPR